MRLKEIKLAGFKSFVDPTHVTIPGQVVGVVGPNGCGKSNVIDAVRWVLGESSARQLRGETMQDVIFNGAGERRPSARASVELVFDNQHGRASGEWSKYAEIAIRRVLEREGNSEYYINGIQVRRRDVSDLFLGTGVGARAYGIIEQGMISQIIEARPEELRVFLEEAAGVSKYRERRRETEQRIGDTRDNLHRVNDIRQELEKQLEHLQGQAEVAARYREMQSELAGTQHLLWYTRRQEAANQRARLARDIERQSVEAEAEAARMREAERRGEELRVRFYEATDAVSAAQGVFYQASAEVARLEQQIQHVRDSRARVEAQLAQVERQLERASAEESDTTSALAEWRGKLADARSVLEERMVRLAAENERLPIAEEARARALESLAALRAEAARAEQALHVEAARRDHAGKVLEQLELRRNRLEQERAALVVPDAFALERGRGELAEIESELTTLRSTLTAEGERLPVVEQSLREATHAARAAASSISGLEATRAALVALQERIARGADAKAWAERHGLAAGRRFWQCIRVENGWDDALEAVLGVRLNAIAVERLDPAAGWMSEAPPARVALFDEQSGDAELARAASLSFRALVPLAAHVRSLEARAAAVVSEWLRGVYLCEDLASALALRGELPPGGVLVTRAGHVVSPHGVCFHAPDNELHGVLARERDIERLAREIETERATATDRRRIESEREQEVAALRNRIAALRGEIEALQERAHGTELEVLRLSELIERTTRRGAQITSELDEIGVQHAAESAAHAQAGANVDRHGAALAQLRDQLAVGEARFRECEQAAAGQRRAVQVAEKESQEAVFAERTCEQRIRDLEAALARVAESRGQFATNRVRLAEDAERFDDGALAAELQTALGLRSDHEAVLQQARDGHHGIENDLRAAEQERLASEQKLGPLRDRIADLRLKEQEARITEEQFAGQLAEAGADEAALAGMLERGTRSSHLNAEIARIQAAIEALGAVNLAALDELATARERKTYLDTQSADLEQALETLESAIRRIDRETRELLSNTFEEVNRHFGELFPALFGGGQAKLVLTGEEILDAGIQVIAQPPGKRNSSIHLLSGGEKALTALSLVFAMFKLNPAPFCMLDEVDAPLDDSNTVRFCNLVRKMAGETQFVFISHNKITMEIAEQLIGVTMQEQGVSRVVAVDIDEALKLSEKQAA